MKEFYVHLNSNEVQVHSYVYLFFIYMHSVKFKTYKEIYYSFYDLMLYLLPGRKSVGPFIKVFFH